MKMPKLAVLYLTGNDVCKKIQNYRKKIIASIPTLKYLDDRPVFEEDRRFAEAFMRGGIEEERAERRRWNQEKEDRWRRNHEAFRQMVGMPRTHPNDEETRASDNDANTSSVPTESGTSTIPSVSSDRESAPSVPSVPSDRDSAPSVPSETGSLPSETGSLVDDMDEPPPLENVFNDEIEDVIIPESPKSVEAAEQQASSPFLLKETEKVEELKPRSTRLLVEEVKDTEPTPVPAKPQSTRLLIEEVDDEPAQEEKPEATQIKIEEVPEISDTPQAPVIEEVPETKQIEEPAQTEEAPKAKVVPVEDDAPDILADVEEMPIPSKEEIQKKKAEMLEQASNLLEELD